MMSATETLKCRMGNAAGKVIIAKFKSLSRNLVRRIKKKMIKLVKVCASVEIRQVTFRIKVRNFTFWSKLLNMISLKCEEGLLAKHIQHVGRRTFETDMPVVAQNRFNYTLYLLKTCITPSLSQKLLFSKNCHGPMCITAECGFPVIRRKVLFFHG
jgi:hypothetical protein